MTTAGPPCRGRWPRRERSAGSAPRWSSTRSARATRSPGCRVRELGLPREALVSVIVRGDEAILPRGSTRVEAGDRLHVVVRQEVARSFPELIERWRSGPMGPRARPRTRFPGHPPIFSVRPWAPTDGDPASPDGVAGKVVVEQLRSRHDQPGSVVVLEDGRYAVTGSLLIVGSAMQVRRQARKCLQPDRRRHGTRLVARSHRRPGAVIAVSPPGSTGRIRISLTSTCSGWASA